MVPRNITLGGRSFVAAGVSLGTVRRVPGAVNRVTALLRSFGDASEEDKATFLAPAPDDMMALVRLLHDCIIAGKTDVIAFDALLELVDDMGIADGLTQMITAAGEIFRDVAKTEPESPTGDGASGNSPRSESAN